MSTPATKSAFEKPVEKVLLTKSYDTPGRKRVFVIPATVHLGGETPAKTIEWVNQTGGLVKIWLPNADHYLNRREGRDFSEPFDVFDGETITLAVKDRKDLEEAVFYYEYNVYCESIKDYAQGNSAPGFSCP